MCFQDEEVTAIMIERRLRAHQSLILAGACPYPYPYPYPYL